MILTVVNSLKVAFQTVPLVLLKECFPLLRSLHCWSEAIHKVSHCLLTLVGIKSTRSAVLGSGLPLPHASGIERILVGRRRETGARPKSEANFEGVLQQLLRLVCYCFQVNVPSQMTREAILGAFMSALSFSKRFLTVGSEAFFTAGLVLMKSLCWRGGALPLYFGRSSHQKWSLGAHFDQH